jgi:hypothetical protein
MANILKVHEQNTIQQLLDLKWSIRRIARELGIDRKTVRRYAESISKSPTISTPGLDASDPAKSPISIPGSQGVAAPALDRNFSVGRPSHCEPHRHAVLLHPNRKLLSSLHTQSVLVANCHVNLSVICP